MGSIRWSYQQADAGRRKDEAYGRKEVVGHLQNVTRRLSQRP